MPLPPEAEAGGLDPTAAAFAPSAPASAPVSAPAAANPALQQLSPTTVLDDGERHVLVPDLLIPYMAKGTRIRALRQRVGANVDPLKPTEPGAMRKIGMIMYRRVYIGESGSDRFSPESFARVVTPANFTAAKKEIALCLELGWKEQLQIDARRQKDAQKEAACMQHTHRQLV